jgi:hypothetical protein
MRNRQIRDLVIPLTLALLLLHVVEIAGRRLLLFAAASEWLRSVRLPRLHWPRWSRKQRDRAGVGATEAPVVENETVAPPPTGPPKPAISPLARAKAKARGRVKTTR